MRFDLKHRETCTVARLPVWLLGVAVQQLSRCHPAVPVTPSGTAGWQQLACYGESMLGFQCYAAAAACGDAEH